MKCPKCQTANPEGARFCNECGHNLTPTLEATSKAFSFDEKLAKIERYLPEGLTEKILAQKDKIEGERRQVTVMFCDMEGFTPRVEKLGPEEAYALMDEFYELLIHKVSDYEGSVNDLTGDGIMALFGAPIALEDAPQRALRSALSIHRAVAEFNDQHSKITPIKMRIGVHTGPVVVGTLGNDMRVQFMAVGDTVNLASRMEGLAESGFTYVTEEIFKQTRDLFRFEPVGKKAVKGKKEPIRVYKVLSGREDIYRPRLGSERMIYSKLVGRDSQFDSLEFQVMKVINGAGSIVNIIGEAGIGKSRLVSELKEREVMKKVNLLEGRAISMGRNLSFYPIVDLLKQWVGISVDDREAASFSKLESAIRGVYPEKMYEVLPFVAILMGIKLFGKYAERVKGIEGEALENLILKNVRDLLIKATEQTPLVIVIEDLHWADTSSIEFIESLLRLTERQRILFINVFRPGHTETGDRIVRTVTKRLPEHYVEIVLEPLDERMSEELIANMLNIGGLHYPVIKKVVQRTGGNPFFIEEVVRSFIDEGAVVLKEGTFEATEKMGTVAIPHTINDVLMARIDRLEEKTRSLLKLASVIGRSFFYRVLTEVAAKIRDVDSRLSYLKEIQILRERRRMEELEYLFKHAIAQEAAYESILPLNRKQLHLRVAVSIEKVFGERLHDFYGMLAYHYSKADSLEKAEEYLVKAGEEALKSSASNEALFYYQEALVLYLREYGEVADPARVAMLEKNIAFALYNRGQYEEALEYFDKALGFYWGKLPKNAISITFRLLSASLHFLIALYIPFLKFRKDPARRDIEVADLFLKKLKALSVIEPKRFFLEYIYVLKTLTHFNLERFELGFVIFMGASTLFSFTGILFGLSRKILDSVKDKVDENDEKQLILYDLSQVQYKFFEGNWESIKRHNDDLVKRNLKTGEIYFASQHLYWHGLSYIYQGSLGIAESIVIQLNHIFEEYENEIALMLKQVLNSSLLMESRRLHDALVEINEAIDFYRKVDYGLGLIHMYSCKARIQLLNGNIDQAEASLEHADRIRHEVNSVPWQLANFCRARFECDLFRLEEAMKNGEKSAKIRYRQRAAKSSKMLLRQSRKVPQNRTDSYRLKAAYCRLIKRERETLKWLQKAIEEGERLGARLELSRTYFDVGKHLLQSERKNKMLNGIKAEEYLEKAKALFEEMDLQWDLNRLFREFSG